MANLDFFEASNIQGRPGGSVFLNPKDDPSLEEPKSPEQPTISEYVEPGRDDLEANIEDEKAADPNPVSGSEHEGSIKILETPNVDLNEGPQDDEVSLFVGPETPSLSEDSFGDEYKPARDEDSPESVVDTIGSTSRPVQKAANTVVSHKRTRSSEYGPVSVTVGLEQKNGNVSDVDSDKAAKKKKGKYKRLTDEERVRKAAEVINKAHPISTSKDNLSPEDSMLLDMRAINRSWPEIRDKWSEMFGTTPASSTLPNRFYRLRNNIGIFTEEEDQQLLESKANIEQRFEESKWAMIASSMAHKMGNDWPSFSAQALEKRFKQLMDMDMEVDEGLAMED